MIDLAFVTVLEDVQRVRQIILHLKTTYLFLQAKTLKVF